MRTKYVFIGIVLILLFGELAASSIDVRSAAADRIKSLPGLPVSAPKFEHYSGFIKVSETRFLFTICGKLSIIDIDQK